MVDNLFVVSMISRRHRAVVVKVAFVVGVLYLMGMLKVARDTPSVGDFLSVCRSLPLCM